MPIKNILVGNWIKIGNRDAVVCTIEENEIEVVYLDRDRAINEKAHLLNNEWVFVNDRPCGGYADNNSRLSKFVSILRSGNHY